jgi:DNA modification methylase
METLPAPEAPEISPPVLRESVIQGDCVQVMANMSAQCVDLIITDPPYLCRFMDRSGRRVLNDDRDDWVLPAYAQMYRVLKPNTYCVTFYGWHRVDAFMHAWRSAGFRILEHLVFTKQYESSRLYVGRRHEQAYVLAKGLPHVPDSEISDVIPWQYTGNRLHPTQKPVSVLRQLIEAFSRPGQSVLDPFCGSGSTLIAAREAGRRSIGIELDERHARTAEQRLAA